MRYREAGVDTEQADRLVELIKRLNPRGGGQIGPFAALYDLGSILRDYREPLLVSSTDGIGTKTKVAIEYGKLDGLGQDLVAMNVNDLICLGAKPLFLLDYYATAKLDLDVSCSIFEGLVKACDHADCMLVGGETAQLSDIFSRPNDLELVGFVVGIVEKSRIPDSRHVKPGDALIGLAATGPHCNGYTIIRKVVKERQLDLHETYAEAGSRPLGELLLEPMPIYCKSVLALFDRFPIRGAAHITGGGISGNLMRALNERVDAVVHKDSWPKLKVFQALRTWGDIPEDEMWDIFNMGLGFIAVLPKAQAENALMFLEKRGDRAYWVGEIVRGQGRVVFA